MSSEFDASVFGAPDFLRLALSLTGIFKFSIRYEATAFPVDPIPQLYETWITGRNREIYAERIAMVPGAPKHDALYNMVSTPRFTG